MTWIRPVATTGTLAILATLLLAVVAMPASAADRGRGRTDAPGHARFEGRHIDLTTGWRDARACVVWTRDGETDCFRTDAEAEDAIQQRDRGTALAPVASGSTAAWSMATVADRPLGFDPFLPFALPTRSCDDWLVLYEHTGFDGRSLRFRDQGYYQDLADWGFAGQTSSYRVGSCSAAMRDGGWSAYPGSTGAGSQSASMLSGWNDRVRYLRIS